jgi:hypothetical protein
MLKSKVFAFALVLMVLMGMTPFRVQSESATSNPSGSTAAGQAAQNKFVGRWTSQITSSTGEVFNDGVFDISEAAEPSADEVSVVHSLRGGPVKGHTMGYPDRIEIQISLGDGRIAHYNGVLVSATKIEGTYFVTGRPQSHHSRKLVVSFAESGDWTAQAGST